MATIGLHASQAQISPGRLLEPGRLLKDVRGAEPAGFGHVLPQFHPAGRALTGTGGAL